jgi:hypothetical protein
MRRQSVISVTCDNGLTPSPAKLNNRSCTTEAAQQEDLVGACRDAAAELGKLPGIVSAALHKSVDGTRVVNDMRVRSVEDWENLRKVSQTKGYFDRIVKFGTPDMYVHEVIDTRERAVS